MQLGGMRFASLRENSFLQNNPDGGEKKGLHLTLKPEVFFEGKRIHFSLKGITDCNYIILVN